MIAFYYTVFITCLLGALLLPPRSAPFLLLISALLLGDGIGILLGTAYFPSTRSIGLVALFRLILTTRIPFNLFTGIDKCFYALIGITTLFSFMRGGGDLSPLAVASSGLGLVAFYSAFRFADLTEKQSIGLLNLFAILLLTVAVEMLYEQRTGRTLYPYLGQIGQEVAFRVDSLRSQGPFRHAILGGTVGAISFFLLEGLRERSKALFWLGKISALTMVVTSHSSGPMMALVFGQLFVWTWRYRSYYRYTLHFLFISYIALEILMARPAYYIIANIDLTGGSTGWHRARLIEMAISHVHEWWLIGTNITGHWMPTGVAWSTNQADITNYSINWAISGGILGLICFFVVVSRAFRQIWRVEGATPSLRPTQNWMLGGSLVAGCSASLSTTYFDQSSLFFWLPVALTAASQARRQDCVC